MIRLTKTNQRRTNTFFSLALLTLFAITSFIVIFIGTIQYRFVSNNLIDNSKTRTASSYFIEKFNQYDSTDSIFITELDGILAIQLTQTEQSEKVFTYIYVYDGYLRELTTPETSNLSLAFGNKITEANALHVEIFSSHLYCITITDTSGTPHSTYISLNAR